jgi:hypothetical protein
LTIYPDFDLFFVNGIRLLGGTRVNIFKAICQAVIESDDVRVTSLTKDALASNFPALEILQIGAV